jgi:hypothetical protein
VDELSEYLDDLLENAARRHKARKDHLRRGYWGLHIGVMTLGGLSTVLLGLQFNSPSYVLWSRNVALALGALSVLMTGLITFWNIDSYWLKRKVILNELTLLQERFRFIKASDQEMSKQDLQEIFARYMEIEGEHSAYWEKILANTSKSRGDEASIQKDGRHEG